MTTHRRFVRTALASLAVLSATCASTASAQFVLLDPQAQMRSEIDALVTEVMQERQLPGVTLSITRHGQPIYAQGYGKADVASNKAMTADTRARIGSVTKAIVTGPAGFRMLEQQQIEPSQQKVYGTGGLLGNDYLFDQAIGVARHTPIIEMDIASDDRVYTWYQNGTYSIGSSNDLDRYQAPKPFFMPGTARPVDIRAIAIGPLDLAYVWFENSRTADTDAPSLFFSSGAPDNLGSVQQPSATPVTLPSGYHAHDVVGVTRNNAENRVYVWYADGKMSVGTNTNFARWAQPADYTVAPQQQGNPNDIRGIGIAPSSGKVYTWFANGKATIGSPNDLDQHYAPYGYSIPALSNLPDWKQWYRDMTVQNLLDHRAGFTRSSETDKAAAYFGVSEEALTYEQIHQHFLRTRKLITQPGVGGVRYSNHGFGLWTLLIKAATGIPFETYVRDHYLKPLGLDADIQAQGATHDSRDATNYVLTNGTYTALPIEASGNGLAAGGFRASARGLTKAMAILDQQYSYTCLNQMGWGTGDGGELQHFGALDGGMSFVTMFPPGYTSASGKNLGGLHIALVANRWARPSRFDELRDAIADKVAHLNVQAPAPTGYSSGGFELSCQNQ